MLKQVKITGNSIVNEVIIEGQNIPVADATISFNFNDSTAGVPRITMSNFIKDFEFSGNAEVVINGIAIGDESEKRLYEQLRKKYEGVGVNELVNLCFYLFTLQNKNELFIPLGDLQKAELLQLETDLENNRLKVSKYNDPLVNAPRGIIEKGNNVESLAGAFKSKPLNMGKTEGITFYDK
jgi:hypothetical protein